MVYPDTQVKSAVPLLLQLPVDLSNNQVVNELLSEVETIVKRYQLDIGMILPKIDVHWYGDYEKGWTLMAYEVPIVSGSLESSESTTRVPAMVRDALRKNGTLFIGLQETSTMLTQLSADVPDIVKEVLRIVPIHSISIILKNLVEEEIPIRNLRAILEALIETGQHEKDVNNLTEYARVSLKRQISHRFAPNGIMQVVTLTPQLEEKLLNSIRATTGKVQLALSPNDADKIIKKIAESINAHSPAALVTSIQIRRHVRKMIETPCFDTSVLSHNELMPQLTIQVLDSIDTPEMLLEAV
jgi:type III secretion protein V